MRLRSIRLENVRRFTSPVVIEGITDGLNVLSEPNESGKSTLFDAIQALFFIPHGSKNREIASLRPHAGGAPEVAVEIETDAGRFTVAKRWFSKAAATVHQGSRLVAQSDEAEAWLADLLGGAEGGPSGLIWVRQGLTHLGAATPKEEKAALEARRDLMSSIGEEVEAMTGGRRMDAALDRCREELARYATGKSRRPQKGGPWFAAQERVQTLEGQRATLVATADALHEALAARKRCRRELAELEDPDATRARADRLEAARAALVTAERHAEELDTEARRLETAQLTLSTAHDRLDRFRSAAAERDEAAAEERATSEAAAAARAAQDAAQQARDAAESGAQAAQAALEKADAAHRRAERAQAARDGAARRDDLVQRIAAAEAARKDMEEAAAAARRGPDAAAMRRLEALVSAHGAAVAARDISAPRVTARYLPGVEGRIRHDGQALGEGTPLPLSGAARLEMDGIGTLDIHPGETGTAADTVAKSETALREALAQLGAETPDAARDAAEARALAERRQGEAQAVFRSLAPEGIEPLREALALIPEAEAAEDAGDADRTRAALREAQDTAQQARAGRDHAAEALAEARLEAVRLTTALTSASDRQKRATEVLARFGAEDETALNEALDRATTACTAAEARLAEKSRAAPDLASAKAAMQRAESVDRRARDDLARLKPQLATLDERIARSAGEAVEERLAETEQALDAARTDLARIEHEVAVLTRLEAALESARSDARERYFTPVAAELRPLLQLLWPEAELTWGEETLLPEALVRDGAHEPVDILSGGTQEQLALLVRLAFARMLSAAGRPAPVILDDALVFTDDDRIERMFDALTRQAGDLQILVLTCRQRAFRELGGTALQLAAPDGS
ncbi:MAG: chromosome segregation protein SMC [Yangia sp.]|nr:chromosome segregation protein SMC [Salipiger sp.]